jgi:membrane protein YqaA with SNARE-associated domain
MTEGSTTTPEKRGLFRALYDWVMANATGRHAWIALFCLSFAESSFFPMPPDLLLIPMVLADRRRAFLIALVCTVGSVLGGMLGYTIGSLLYNSVGHWLISVYGSGDLDAFRAAYAKYGQWIILLQGLTPIPYKIVSIATGFAAFPFATFVLMSAITRGFRYFTEASLLYLFGDPIRAFIEKRFMLTLGVAFAVIVLGFVMVRYAF